MKVKRQSNGQIIYLDPKLKIGGGGEGEIYQIPGNPSVVVKIYKKPTREHFRKLTLMINNPPDDPMASKGHISIAWPLDLLFRADTGDFVGFIMPRVSGNKILDFYHPKSRIQKFPFFNYLYLLRTARNLASAIHALHLKGYVVGDINESNILVKDNALVTLVDTDSFQVRDPQTGFVYRCPVGRGEYTPPELRGKNFRDVDRAVEHDLFGLAVIIFKLLMEGTHPFDGTYTGKGDLSLEERIGKGYFPYARRGKVPCVPKPLAPPFNILHPAVQDLFLLCFEDGHHNPKARPDAGAWVKALEEMENELITCSVNDQHLYGRHLSFCPWCERAAKFLGGIDPFPPKVKVRQQSVTSQTQKPLPSLGQPRQIAQPQLSQQPPSSLAVPKRANIDWNIVLLYGILNAFLFGSTFGLVRLIIASTLSDRWFTFNELQNHPNAPPIGIIFFLSFSALIALYIGYRRRQIKQAASNVAFGIQGLFSWFLYSFGAFLQIIVSLIALAVNPATAIPAIGGMLLVLLAFILVLASLSFLGLATITVMEHMAGIWRLLGFSPVTGWAINGGLLGVVLGASEGFQRTGFPQAQRLVAALATPLALLLAIVPISKTTPFHPTALPSQIYKPNKTTRIVQVTANVREGAGTNFPKITVVDKGEVVELVGISPDGEWAKVRLSDGTVGYIHCKLLGTGHPKGLPERDKPIKNYRAHQNLTPSKPPESQELLKISKYLDSLVWSPLKELAGENDPEKIKRRAQNLLKQWERNEKEFKKHLIALLKLTEKVNCWDDEMKSEFYSALLTAYCGLGRFEDALRERERLESLRSKTGEPIFSAEDLKRIDDYVSAAQAIWRLKGEDKG
ncbi:MAG: SH3 domain-containing protein [Archaeoglobaceae archaeon]